MTEALARLLLVEDDGALREAMTAALESCGFVVRAEPNGLDINEVVARFRPDAAILDVALGAGPDGFEIAAQIRQLASVPIIFSTAADALDDRLRGFELGADDYIVKPFAIAELLARIRAVLRRSDRLASPTIQVRDLIVDEANRLAIRDGADLELTQTEFELLSVFVRSPDRVFSKPQLLSLVWHFDEYDPNLVEVHLSALRRKMETRGVRLIHTVRGAGYELRS